MAVTDLDIKKIKRLLQQATTSVSSAMNAVIDWANITNKPTEFLPENHEHDEMYLNKNNTEPFTPEEDYEPATKKYVDDNAGLVGTKEVDETDISGNKILQYKSGSGKLEYINIPSGGGGGASLTEFSTYQDLLDDTTVEDGNYGVVTNMMNAIFIKFTDWYAMGRKLIWKLSSYTKWYLPMENSVEDRSGNGYDATATSITYVTGKVGDNAADFNGTTSKAIYLGNILGGAVITNITMMCWVYISGTSLKGMFIDIGSNPDGSGFNTRGFGIGVGNTSADTNGNNLIAIYNAVRWIATGRAIGTGWHHVALTINNTSKPTVYLDGFQVYTDTGTNPTGLSATTPNACVGSTYNNRFFAGYVDEVIVETRLWSSQEIFEYFMQTH